MPIPEKLGPFRLIRLLGKGGMGAVYLVEYDAFPVPVALKILLSPSDGDTVRLERFETEIDTLRRLHHENIVRMIGFGESEGYRYFAMEYIDGPSLETLLRKKRSFTWEETVDIGISIARALRHAHDRGIIHRDIKPANILLTKEGQVKVSDYGIAHLFGEGRVTAADTVIGTLDYMSPEQASSNVITPKTDLFSLGAVLYTLLVRTPPFRLETKSLPALLNRFLEGPAESVRLRRRDVPLELDELLQKLLEHDPKKRPPNAQIVQRRLESILESHSVQGGLARFFNTDDALSGNTADIHSSETAAMETAATSSRVHLTPDGSSSVVSDADQTVTTGVLSGKDETLSVSESILLDGNDTASSRSQAVTLPVKAESPSEFTPVSDKEFNPLAAEPERTFLVSARTVLFLSALILAGTFIGLALRTPSADRLYRRIETQLNGVTPESGSDYNDALYQARGNLLKFLSLYPNDPRADDIRRLNGDLELAQLEVRLNRMAERSVFRLDPPGSLIEAAYIEALRTADRDPEEGARKLRAFLSIFERDDLRAAPYSVPAQCVRLAHRRLELLEKRLKSQEETERELVAEQLAYAESLEQTDPRRAAEIREGLRRFYGSRSWAGELFDK